ncbi:MAG: hypothetical protein ABR879_07945 [Methanomassiliicoccales archaeon]
MNLMPGPVRLAQDQSLFSQTNCRLGLKLITTQRMKSGAGLLHCQAIR